MSSADKQVCRLTTEDGTLIYPEGPSLFECNLNTGEKTKYMSLLECGIPSDGLEAIGRLDDGTIAGFIKKYNRITEKWEFDIVKLKEVSEEEYKDRTKITIACDVIPSELEDLIIEANKNGNEYLVDVMEFSGRAIYNRNKYDCPVDGFEAVKAQYYSAMADNHDIDVVVFADDGYKAIQDFGKKGLLTDLTPLMENSNVIKKSDVFENIIDLCTVDNKLVALPKTASLLTLAGNAKEVGSNQGWTLDNALELMNSKPDGTELIGNMSRKTVLSKLLSANYSYYVDLNAGSCNFDNDDFKKLLEIAKMFPEVNENEGKYEPETDLWENRANGSVICNEIDANNGDVLQASRTVCKDDITMVGYPAVEGNGALLNFNTMVAVTVNAKEPQACFNLLSPLFDKMDYTPQDQYVIPLPIRKDNFENLMKGWIESTKKYKSRSYYVSNDLGSVDLEPTNQADVDAIREAYSGATGVNGAVPYDIMQIIEEEAKEFFNGEKTADEVAPLIQSRVSIYMSETM